MKFEVLITKEAEEDIFEIYNSYDRTIIIEWQILNSCEQSNFHITDWFSTKTELLYSIGSAIGVIFLINKKLFNSVFLISF